MENFTNYVTQISSIGPSIINLKHLLLTCSFGGSRVVQQTYKTRSTRPNVIFKTRPTHQVNPWQKKGIYTVPTWDPFLHRLPVFMLVCVAVFQVVVVVGDDVDHKSMTARVCLLTVLLPNNLPYLSFSVKSFLDPFNFHLHHNVHGMFSSSSMGTNTDI